MALLDILPHRTPAGRAHSVETYGEEATSRVERIQPYLDSLSVKRLGEISGVIRTHLVKYAMGFLGPGMDHKGSFARQSVLNRLDVEVSEVAYWKERDAVPKNPVKPILERVKPDELGRIHSVLGKRLGALYSKAVEPGLKSEEKDEIVARTKLLNARRLAVGESMTERRAR